MPWTDLDLGLDKNIGDNLIKIMVELSEDDIQSLITMVNWAWDNNWFENSISETKCSQLLKTANPKLFDIVYTKSHQKFCTTYPNSENLNGFGVYEIFFPDSIVEFATYSREDKSSKI